MFYASGIQAIYFGIFLAYAVTVAQEVPKLIREKAMTKQTESLVAEHPQESIPYDTESAVYRNNSDDITLAGTFTKPKGDGSFPVVILIAGMGARKIPILEIHQ